MATYNGPTIEVNTFLQTKPIATQNFKYPMVVVPHNLTSGVVDSFTSTKSITGLGAAVNSPIYQFVSGLTAGIAAPDLVKIARCDVTSILATVVSIPEEGEDIAINVNVNGVAKTISYTIQAGNTTTEAAAGLEAAFTTAFPQSETKNPAATPSTNVITFAITADTFSTSVGWSTLDDYGVPHTTVEDTTSATIADVIASAQSADSDFSFVLAEAHTQADQVALAAFAASNNKQYYTSTSEVEVKDNTSDANVALVLGALGQDEVSMQYSAFAETHFPEAALVGNICSIDPYRSNNQNMLTLSGVPVDKLTDTEIVTLTARNVNFYVSEYGSGAYHEGWAMSGNFVDVIRFSQWYTAKCEEALYLLYKQASDAGRVIEYSDVGKLKMESRIRNDVVNLGIRGGTIATGSSEDPVTGARIDLNPYIDFGTRAQQSNNNIAQRVWADGISEVVYISGINHTKLNNYIVLNRDPA